MGGGECNLFEVETKLAVFFFAITLWYSPLGSSLGSYFPGPGIIASCFLERGRTRGVVEPNAPFLQLSRIALRLSSAVILLIGKLLYAPGPGVCLTIDIYNSVAT